MQNFEKIRKLFFVGIGGIGVSALAKFFSAQGHAYRQAGGPASGWKISGSDKYASEITDDLKKQGIKIYIGHKEKNLDPGTDLVIYSPAVNPEIPERKKATRLGIKQLSYPEVLGLISRDKYTIAVSGTHGKSTTTAMLGLILIKAGFDPTVIVGSKVKRKGFNENIRIGKSKYFVVEACEWQGHMLKLSPRIIVLTNIEQDHLDYYKTFKNLKNAFKKYVNRLSKSGLLIFNADDKNCAEIVKSAKCKTAGYNIKSDFDFSLRVPGQFNRYNALAAATCALELEIKPEIIKKTLVNFKGIWRRFEKIGEYRGALFFSDYAHHPTAIKETLKAAKELYPKKRLVVVYQPHHFDRTKRLFKNFITAFDQADLVILDEIYDVPGRESVRQVSSKNLAKELERRNIKSIFTENLKKTWEALLTNIKRGDLVLIMGAGDIYNLKFKMKS